MASQRLFLSEKRGPLFLFRFFKFIKRQILLPAGFISHLYFFVICKVLPAFRTKFERNLQRLSTRGTKHGVEGRRRSCVTVPFSLPTLAVLGRMCCEDFEMCCEDSKCVAKILKCVVKISKFVVNLKCVSKNLRCVSRNLKCVVHNLKCVPGAHQMEPPSPIQALGASPFPRRFIIRTVPRGDFARRRWEEPITTTK